MMTPYRIRSAAALLLAVMWAAGCDNRGAIGAFGTPQVPAYRSTLEFRGERACADCIGIEASLVLEQRGQQQRYRLIEVYRAVDRERRFEDEGEWQSTGDLLRLISDGEGERVYQVLPDNRLQATDSLGRPLPAVSDEVMIPVGYSNDR